MNEDNYEKIPNYPVGTTRAIGHLTKSVKSIDIYVEDRNPNTVKIWKTILRKVVPNEFKVKVRSCGGRDKVIRACEKDDIDDGRCKLFIIDADMDILTGNSVPNLKYLYRLPVYCVENFLLEGKNILDLCDLLDTESKKRKFTTHFSFENWKERNSALFEKLFVCYALVQKIGEEKKDTLPNVNHPVQNLCQPPQNEDMLSSAKVNERINKLHDDLQKKGYNEIKFKKFESIILNNLKTSNFMYFVCGKSHLFELIYIRLKKFQINESTSVIKLKLAQNISPDFDINLHLTIKEICNSYSSKS